MSSKYWIKLYHEVLDDPKMGQLPDHLWRRAVEVFLLAGEMDIEGNLPPVADMAWKLRSDAESLTRDLQELARINIVTLTETGWFVCHFKERQGRDTDAERMQRYRNALRERPKSVQKRNAAVTAGVTTRNTDIDKDEDKEIEEDVDEYEEKEKGEGEGEGEEDVVVDAGKASSNGNFFDIPSKWKPLSNAFTEATSIPARTGGNKLVYGALSEMSQAGVEPEDIKVAVKEMREKGYRLANLRSIVNPAIQAMDQRVNEPHIISWAEANGYSRA